MPVSARGTRWRRLGPWWRWLPDVVAHRLVDRGWLPRWLRPVGLRFQDWACQWRGEHAYSYRIG